MHTEGTGAPETRDAADPPEARLGHGMAALLLGRDREAALAYEAAIALTENAAEREFLRRRRESLAGT